MPWKGIQINQPVYSNVNDVSLTDRTPERFNTFRDDAGATVKRPGFSKFVSLGTNATVDGLFDWQFQNLVIAVSDTHIFKIEVGGNVTEIGSNLLERGRRPAFADFGENLYIANGGGIIKVTPTGASKLPDPNIPDNVCCIAAFDTYLLALKEGTAQIHRSDVLDPETWSGNFITAEQHPDILTAIDSRWNEFWGFGKHTIERFLNDGETPFVPVDGGVISTGCQAPRTIQWIRGAYYWLNERRELVRSSGQHYEIISHPIQNILQEARQIDNAIADYHTVGGEDFYVLTLPTYQLEGITLVYDVKKDEWQGKWTHWNEIDAKHERYQGQSYTYVPNWNKHLLGDKGNGDIYDYSTIYNTDDGDMIRAVWLTGHIDHGTHRRKRSYKLRFRLLRGYGSNNPQLMIRWRDDGARTWGNTHYLDLGDSGEYEFYVSIRRLGMYRSRQYEISVTDDVPVIMAGAEESVEALNR